jgi:hypothetical protein
MKEAETYILVVGTRSFREADDSDAIRTAEVYDLIFKVEDLDQGSSAGEGSDVVQEVDHVCR